MSDNVMVGARMRQIKEEENDWISFFAPTSYFIFAFRGKGGGVGERHN